MKLFYNNVLPTFAPNESVRKNEILPYADVEIAVYQKPIEHIEVYTQLPKEDLEFIEAHICAEWNLSLREVPHHLNIAKRILWRSIINN